RQHIDLTKQVFDSLGEPWRGALCTPVSQLGSYDDAGADTVLADLRDPFRGFALRVSDQVGDDAGVQEVAGQSTFSGAGMGSSISGNFSFSGFIVLSKAMSPRLRTGSITSRSPSRCMMASSPGSSNSRRMR